MQNERLIHDKPNVSLVIGAGSIKCAAAIGVYDVLQQVGVQVNQVVGCSGGSIYASLIALGLEPAQIEQEVRRLWTRELTEVKRLKGYLMAALPRYRHFKEQFSVRDDKLIVERLRAAFGAHTIERTLIPLFINATDLNTGQEVVFQEGDIVEAIRASIAIPAVFQPHQIGERLYSDGMLSNPLPIDIAAKSGADIIIAVGFHSNLSQNINSLSRFNRHINKILTNSLLRAHIELCERAYGAHVLVLEPQLNERVGLFDTEKVPQLVQAGKASMGAQIEWLEQKLSQLMQSRNVIAPLAYYTNRPSRT